MVLARTLAKFNWDYADRLIARYIRRCKIKQIYDTLQKQAKEYELPPSVYLELKRSFETKKMSFIKKVEKTKGIFIQP